MLQVWVLRNGVRFPLGVGSATEIETAREARGAPTPASLPFLPEAPTISPEASAYSSRDFHAVGGAVMGCRHAAVSCHAVGAACPREPHATFLPQRRARCPYLRSQTHQLRVALSRERAWARWLHGPGCRAAIAPRRLRRMPIREDPR
jgi:hypothetical protein